MQADEEHASPAARPGNRSGGCVGRAAGLDDDIESDTVAEFEQQLGQVVSGRVCGLLSPERRCCGQPLVVDVYCDDTSVRLRGAMRRRR